MYCKIFVNDQGDKPILLNVLAKEFQAESIHINTLLFPAGASLESIQIQLHFSH